MPYTLKTKFPYPDFKVDPWFDAFISMVEALDYEFWAEWEDRNIILMRGGQISWSVVNAKLSWTNDIEVLSALVGFYLRIPAGYVNLQEGEMFYVSAVRSPTGIVTVEARVASQLRETEKGEDFVVIAVRRNNKIYFRNGAHLGDGDSYFLFEVNYFGSGGGSQGSPFITMATNEVNPAVIPDVVGMFEVNPLDFGTTTVGIQFDVIGWRSGMGDGFVQLYDVTNMVELVTHDFAGGSAVRMSGAAGIFGAPTMVEVRHWFVGIDGAVHTKWAGLKLVPPT